MLWQSTTTQERIWSQNVEFCTFIAMFGQVNRALLHKRTWTEKKILHVHYSVWGRFIEHCYTREHDQKTEDSACSSQCLGRLTEHCYTREHDQKTEDPACSSQCLGRLTEHCYTREHDQKTEDSKFNTMQGQLNSTTSTLLGGQSGRITTDTSHSSVALAMPHSLSTFLAQRLTAV